MQTEAAASIEAKRSRTTLSKARSENKGMH